MFTSNEIRNIEFEEVKRGYNQTDVKAFLRKISEQIEEMEKERTGIEAEKTAVFNEKSALEQKMLILADKVEDYRKDEDNLRTALLSAQRLSDTIVKEANANAEVIQNDARLKADELLNEAKRKIEAEKESFQKIRKEVSKFKNEVLSIYKSHLEILSMIPETDDRSNAAAQVEKTENSTITNYTPEYGEIGDSQAKDSDAESTVDTTEVYIQPEPLDVAQYSNHDIQPVVPEEAEPETPDDLLNAEPVNEANNGGIIEQTENGVHNDDTVFYAPVAPDTSDNPFADFSNIQEEQTEPEISDNTIEYEGSSTKTEDKQPPVEGKEEPSRFGQLDFGEGFSFSTK